MSKDSIIIIREQDELVAACCVPFDGDFAKELGSTELFLGTKQIIKSTGELYRSLRNEYGERIELDVVDPRNQIYLFPRLVRDIFRYKVPFLHALKTIFFLRSPAVICNGRLIMSGENQLSANILNKIKDLIH